MFRGILLKHKEVGEQDHQLVAVGFVVLQKVIQPFFALLYISFFEHRPTIENFGDLSLNSGTDVLGKVFGVVVFSGLGLGRGVAVGGLFRGPGVFGGVFLNGLRVIFVGIFNEIGVVGIGEILVFRDGVVDVEGAVVIVHTGEASKISIIRHCLFGVKINIINSGVFLVVLQYFLSKRALQSNFFPKF